MVNIYPAALPLPIKVCLQAIEVPFIHISQFMTSFVEFIPGGITASFSTAMLLASIVAVVLVAIQFSDNKSVSKPTTDNKR
ncbi:hypothetical protein [Shewanella livingstonensis]|uniref:Uncharacterized protein n=1 Tax=Shewanella livingstonensis TaxID=150120 RepID=A0A3G8LVT0_9GAMM|nr:hypothetical protein [Shewanella livingstonensis]AZG73504.1 hypothetical protein EGC82_12475 [Shewanella livingstonensis]